MFAEPDQPPEPQEPRESQEPPVPQSGRGRYEVLDDHIGEGTYGRVSKCRDRVDGSVVAVKRIRVILPGNDNASDGQVSQFGVHFTVLREIEVMRELEHENLIRLKDVYLDEGTVNLVMPIMKSDLRRLMETRKFLGDEQIKSVMLQIFAGLNCLHKSWFLHRDLTPANVFIDPAGVCKVADFGLSGIYGQVSLVPQQTSQVVTLWYRAPELLFGASYYQDGVDIWSAGCIFAELLLGGRPLFPGAHEIDQLAKIFVLLGMPNQGNWPHHEKLPAFIKFAEPDNPKAPESLRAYFPPNVSKLALDLLGQMLQLNPLLRPSAEAAAQHPYFRAAPPPCLPAGIVHLM